MNLYKKAINKCCMPNCYLINLEVHHIIPLKSGGEDNFNNYICLCKDCHMNHFFHKLGEDKKIILLTIKFMVEQEILGFTSYNYDDEEFRTKLIKTRKNRDKEILFNKDFIRQLQKVSCLMKKNKKRYSK